MVPPNLVAYQMPSGAFGTPTAPGDLDSRYFTGNTVQDSGAIPLTGGARYTMLVTGDDVYLRFQAANVTLVNAASTDFPLLKDAAGGSFVQFTFVARVDKTDRVSVLPAAGTFKCWLWRSSF